MNLFALKEQLREAGILISFTGSFSHSIIEELGTAVKAYLVSAVSQKTAMMDVFSVYIEAAQNVRNYSEQRRLAGATDIDTSILVISRRDTHYRVSAGNVIENADIPDLAARLDRLVAMDKQALKQAYKEQLRRDRGDNDGGAGLGLIEMARRASQPLEYQFTPQPDGRAYFSLSIEI